MQASIESGSMLDIFRTLDVSKRSAVPIFGSRRVLRGPSELVACGSLCSSIDGLSVQLE